MIQRTRCVDIKDTMIYKKYNILYMKKENEREDVFAKNMITYHQRDSVKIC